MSIPIPGLVSIIIPTFNRAILVERAIASALSQDYPHKEVIVIDDGSTDDTVSRMKQFPGIRFERQENRRQGAARNRGLKLAKGEFIASLDSDDCWQLGFLSASIAALYETCADMSFANWTNGGVKSAFERLDYLDEYKVTQFKEWYILSPNQTRHLFIRHCPAPSSAAVIRRSAIHDGWDERSRISDDWFLWLDSVFKKNITATFTARPLWIKQSDGTNICDGNGDSVKLAESNIHDVNQLLQRYTGQITAEEKLVLRRRQAANYFDLAYAEFRGGRKLAAIQHVLHSMCILPRWRLSDRR